MLRTSGNWSCADSEPELSLQTGLETPENTRSTGLVSYSIYEVLYELTLDTACSVWNLVFVSALTFQQFECFRDFIWLNVKQVLPLIWIILSTLSIVRGSQCRTTFGLWQAVTALEIFFFQCIFSFFSFFICQSFEMTNKILPLCTIVYYTKRKNLKKSNLDNKPLGFQTRNTQLW